jgi:hypothetical protein
MNMDERMAVSSFPPFGDSAILVPGENRDLTYIGVGRVFQGGWRIPMETPASHNRQRHPRGALLTVMELVGHSSNTATRRNRGASRRKKRRSAVFARNGIEAGCVPVRRGKLVAGKWNQVVGPVAQVVEHCPFKAILVFPLNSTSFLKNPT